VLARADASPVIALNRAVAIAMRDGPAAGLALIDAILARGELQDYAWRTRRAPTCAGGLDERRMPARRTSGASR